MTPLVRPYLRLRIPVVVSILLLAGSIAVVAGSRHLLATAEGRARSAAQTLADVQRRLADAEHTARQSREALVRLAQIRTAGLDRPIDRVRWVEQIEALRKSMSIAQLDYEIGPEHPHERLASSADVPSYLLPSTLHLRAGLPHEDAFLTLIQQLRQAGPALQPKRCQLSRQMDSAEKESLLVQCELDWLHARIAPHDAAHGQVALQAVQR